jgi:hypothetical protein
MVTVSSITRVVGEDSDATVYELKDGEETPVAGKDGYVYVIGQTCVLKDGLEPPRAFRVELLTQTPTEEAERAIEANLRETIDLCERDIQRTESEANVVEISEQDDDDGMFPIQQDLENEATGIPEGWKVTPERITQAIAIASRHAIVRPDWWSPAWEELTRFARNDHTPIEPVAPAQFKEMASDDAFMIYNIGYEVGKNPDTGEPTDPSTDPELIYMAAGVIWNEQCMTLIRKGSKGGDANGLLLDQFEHAVKPVPNGCVMRYGTHSDWLLEQWNQMMAWKSVNYQGLDRAACTPQRRGIMGSSERRTAGLEMMKLETMEVDQAIVKALM